MSSSPSNTLDPALKEATLQWFDAAELVYNLSRQELAAGRPLEPDGKTPSAIAFEVAMCAIELRIACPEWAARAVAHDWHRFSGFECTSLGDAFGIPDHKYRAARHDELLCAAVYAEVRYLQSKNIPMKDNAKHGKGALSQVGERRHMSGKKIEGLMKLWKDLCKQTGRDPDAKQVYSDPSKMVAAAIARALAERDDTAP